MTDQEIYLGAAAGEKNALRELFVSTRDQVVHVCALYLEGDEHLQSAVVGTYGRAFQLLAQGPSPALPLQSWVGILATRECFTVLQSLRKDYDRQTVMLETLAGSIPTLVEISSDPKERVNFMIRGDIEEIPEKQREVLAMSELEGLHPLAMSKRLGCSWAVAVKSLMQARQGLTKRVK